MDDSIIEHHGDSRSLEDIKKQLCAGRASYWHWNKILYSTIRMYNKAKEHGTYGFLLPDVLMINELSVFDLDSMMCLGGYPKIECLRLLNIYSFLLTEQKEWS